MSSSCCNTVTTTLRGEIERKSLKSIGIWFSNIHSSLFDNNLPSFGSNVVIACTILVYWTFRGIENKCLVIRTRKEPTMKLYIILLKKRMANCFDFRMRTTSFDLHQLAQRRKLKKISNLFRSRSEGSVKDKAASPKCSPGHSPKSSPKQSPKASPTVTRRRFVRVVKDNEAVGEEYENPHIIRRYTQEFIQEKYGRRGSDSFDEDNLPYSVSGHTILKKHTSVDRTESPTGDQSPKQKHASFNEDVEIIEFDRKGKVKACSLCTHVEKLADSDEESSMDICDACLKKGREECPHLSSESESDSELKLDECIETIIVSSSTTVETSSGNTDCSITLVSQESEIIHEKDAITDSIVTKLISTHIDLQESERSRGVILVTDS